MLLLILTLASQHAYGLSPGQYWTEVQTWFRSGGNTMWFILACSVVTVAFTLERLMRLRRSRIAPAKFLSQVRGMWKEGRFDELIERCRKTDNPLARAVQLMVENRNVPVADIRAIVSDAISTELQIHHRRVRPLMLSATVAPLLGLAGTVSGMIGAFSRFRLLGETGDPTVFAGDISVALITTQAGLIVAIPTLALASLFGDRTARLTDELDMAVQQLLIEWFVNPDKDAAPGE